MTLRSRLDRLDPPRGARSIRDMSAAELRAEMIPLLRAWLNDPAMPPEPRADMAGLLADLESDGPQWDPDSAARDGRIMAALQACIGHLENSGAECRS